MASKITLLDQYELLPPGYQYECRIRNVLYGWITVICWLLAILCGVAVMTALRSHRDQQSHDQLVATAMPLIDLRRNVFQLQSGNAQRLKWCQWVESAKPDDDAFQALAAIIASPQDIEIDQLSIRLPLEYPLTAKEVPDWAVPHLAVTARVASPEVAQQWVQRLSRSDRIDAATVDVKPLELAGGRVELTATPRTTRVLP